MRVFLPKFVLAADSSRSPRADVGWADPVLRLEGSSEPIHSQPQPWAGLPRTDQTVGRVEAQALLNASIGNSMLSLAVRQKPVPRFPRAPREGAAGRSFVTIRAAGINFQS